VTFAAAIVALWFAPPANAFFITPVLVAAVIPVLRRLATAQVEYKFSADNDDSRSTRRGDSGPGSNRRRRMQ